MTGNQGRRSPVWTRSCVALAFVFLTVVFVVRVLLPSRPTPEPVKVQTAETAPRRVQRTPSRVFDSDSFYRTIIDNNLFRPLGWTPPRPTEPYRLIGTILPRNDSRLPTAIIETIAGNKTYIVSIGEPLDALTEVVEIKPKQVRLSTAGQQRTLRLATLHYLNPSRVFPRFATQRPTPQRPRQGVRRTPPRAPTAAPSPSRPLPDRLHPLSEWQTREGEVIRIGDARLKNPAKWQLQRRSR